jgi:outer membrane protein assembly factor BamB
MRARGPLVLIVVVLFSVVLAGCDWAQFGFDATHGGFNPREPALYAGAVTRLARAWHRDVVFGPVVANGHLYATAGGPQTSELFSLNPSTGAVQWQVSTASGIATAPVVAGSTVYVTTGQFSPLSSAVKAYDAATGAFRWATPANVPPECTIAGIPNPPTVAAGLVVFTSGSGPNRPSAACAFDASTGAFEWSSVLPGNAGISAPAVANGEVFVAAGGFGASGPQTTVRALDVADGSVTWTKTVTNSFATGTVVVAHGRVLVPAGKLLTFDAATGAPGWTSTADEVSATLDTVIASAPGTVRALSLVDGSERWSITGPSSVTLFGKPAIASGVAYVGSVQTRSGAGECCSHVDLLLLRNGGRVKSIDTEVNNAPPTAVATGGFVYVSDGGITAYRP